MTQTRGLGRGLSAIIPNTAGVDEVDIDLIVPNAQQPRVSISDDALEELAESIRRHGVLQPLLVTPGDSEGVYRLIAGERRLRASRMAGLRKVPVVLKQVAAHEMLELALVENIQREDLNPLEEAQAYRRLSQEFGLTQEAIAARVGRSRTSIANAVRLLALSDEIKVSLMSREITEGHARALLAIEDETTRREAWRRVVHGGLTVRQTEALARRPKPAPQSGAASATTPQQDPEVASLESRLRASLGTKVELRSQPNGRGRLVLHFYSNEQLDGLLDRLGISTA